MIQRDTICYKHDAAQELANQIIGIVDQARDDGMRMETALKQKGKRIAELESELADANEEIQRLQDAAQ